MKTIKYWFSIIIEYIKKDIKQFILDILFIILLFSFVYLLFIIDSPVL
jgi:hypothetical protein